MAIDVTVQTTIRRPRPDVAAFVTNPANDPVWIGGVVDAHPTADGPIVPGSQVARTASFLGRRIDYVTEVTELKPEERLTMRAIEGPFPMTVHYQFEETPDGTRVSVRNEGSASGFFKLAEPLLRNTMKRSVARDLETLKDLLEGAADLPSA